MTWFKVDDTLAFHAKVISAGNAAMGLWVRAGSWSAQQLTDGHVPAHMIPALGNRAQANALVRTGLWVDDDEDGYRFHQWAEEGRQPSREEVETKRREWREKKQRQRRGPSGQYETSPGESPGDTRETPSGSPAVPSRPVPTRPIDGVLSVGGSGQPSPNRHLRIAQDETGLDLD
ncbi:hypothetical protein [Occultella gossypii]|uniref:Uncharacterized protein n=1 Tax=Occultella gossypii TaxID=2800820 RepID=A0ABS7SC39_9MICO|nr:hypothetical protein [Occultella gossypii]MBZ2197259.1 hypothetical protein [Occultella gossypii]